MIMMKPSQRVVSMYVDLVNGKRRTIDSVPAHLQEEVRVKLNDPQTDA